MFYKITDTEALALAKETKSLRKEGDEHEKNRNWSEATSKAFSAEMSFARMEIAIDVSIRDNKAEKLENRKDPSLSEKIRRAMSLLEENANNYNYEFLFEENPFILVRT